MGPSGGIGSTSQRNNGPERSSWHHLLQMLWAHLAAPTAPLTSYQQQLNTMGPFEGVGSISAGTAHIINMGQIDTIGRISLNFEVGPLVVPVHFYSMGPSRLFRLQRSNCTWVLPTTTTKCLPWAPMIFPSLLKAPCLPFACTRCIWLLWITSSLKNNQNCRKLMSRLRRGSDS